MKGRAQSERAGAFQAVISVGVTLPGVEAGTKYNGSPVLRVGGCFMAGLATHPSAEAGTLVVRSGLEERDRLLEEAPDTYYLTDYYSRHPVILARLAKLGRDALRDLLSVSRRLTLPKTRRQREPGRRQPAGARTGTRSSPLETRTRSLPRRRPR
jgi:hypothetical protein